MKQNGLIHVYYGKKQNTTFMLIFKTLTHFFNNLTTFVPNLVLMKYSALTNLSKAYMIE